MCALRTELQTHGELHGTRACSLHRPGASRLQHTHNTDQLASINSVIITLIISFGDCRWGKPVVVYGPSGLGRDHPVVQFLVAEARCSAVHYYKPG